MTPKEKAKYIHSNMYKVSDILGKYPMCFDTAKECALIAVEEILNAHLFDLDEKQFWQQVRTEIANL
jgi:hypothetical protein